MTKRSRANILDSNHIIINVQEFFAIAFTGCVRRSQFLFLTTYRYSLSLKKLLLNTFHG
ncbi:hypothetical protein I8752_29145 [Nostocaceae cyanobacterium CENA369]|uniref:Uncharacterized protein n=1 Tax=Dendronalium phyllosphericum CENA369 TaxID=1725256 RepID=A0A8J7IA87_9NOST|nr:hypothetical protein [Dendronalium phyllosphericum]MBH8576978.1 hypothetical protein [Dendronalium phyllosphericum CENA369]